MSVLCYCYVVKTNVNCTEGHIVSDISSFSRNFHSHSEGTVEEIGFEEFLTVMSYFRPPSLNMTEEQREELRRIKLRCKMLGR